MNLNTKPWQQYAVHTADVKRILTDLRCMDSKGQLRAWKPNAWVTLNAAGHTTLSPDKCKCVQSL